MTQVAGRSFKGQYFLGLASLLAGFLACSPTHIRAAETPQTPSSSCVLNKKEYVCKLDDLRHALDGADAIAIENDPGDIAAYRQLKELAASLGKTVATVPANIVFVLRPVDETGVSIGPSDTDLATLRVYVIRPDSTHRELLWSETYRGQADRPWPIIVHSLIQQFQQRLH